MSSFIILAVAGSAAAVAASEAALWSAACSRPSAPTTALRAAGCSQPTSPPLPPSPVERAEDSRPSPATPASAAATAATTVERKGCTDDEPGTPADGRPSMVTNPAASAGRQMGGGGQAVVTVERRVDGRYRGGCLGGGTKIVLDDRGARECSSLMQERGPPKVSTRLWVPTSWHAAEGADSIRSQAHCACATVRRRAWTRQLGIARRITGRLGSAPAVGLTEPRHDTGRGRIVSVRTDSLSPKAPPQCSNVRNIAARLHPIAV